MYVFNLWRLLPRPADALCCGRLDPGTRGEGRCREVALALSWGFLSCHPLLCLSWVTAHQCASGGALVEICVPTMARAFWKSWSSASVLEEATGYVLKPPWAQAREAVRFSQMVCILFLSVLNHNRQHAEAKEFRRNSSRSCTMI